MMNFLLTILELIQTEETRILKARISLKSFKYTSWARTEYLIESIHLDSWSLHFHALILVMLLQAKEDDQFLLLEEKLRSQGLKDREKWYFFWYSRRYKRLCRDNERSWKAHRQTQYR